MEFVIWNSNAGLALQKFNFFTLLDYDARIYD